MNRIPVSAPKNIFNDGDNIDDVSLTLEQNYNDQVQTGIIDNHFGSGVLPDNLTPTILFDTNAITGLLDGQPLTPQAQPTDTTFGNQIQVELTGSAVAGNRTVKVLVIGLDFQENLQYDTFVFDRNEPQISSKHYTQILLVMLNDFLGTNTQSFNLGGRLVIKDVDQVILSRDCKMVAQDVQPNLFFRDFYAIGGTIQVVLANALPNYNIQNLNITTSYLQLADLIGTDVVSQVGQKFLATSNNIQKITLLMAYDGYTQATPSWTGDILVSIYPLQSSVVCPTDIVPNLAIDFNPSNIPLAQLSISYSSLLNNGIQLTTVPQPVDFVFSNIGGGVGVSTTVGNYYAVTVKRVGSSDTHNIQFAVGTNTSPNMRETLFSGTSGLWIDIPEQSLWFQIWTDAGKVSSGMAYDRGHGIVIPKTQVDPTTGATIDYVLNQQSFLRNDLYYGLLQATTQLSNPVQNERTGQSSDTEQQFVPSLSLLNSTGLSNIQNVAEPFIIGTISDQNVKTYSAVVQNETLTADIHEYGLVGNQLVIKIITDTTDGYRYDTNIIELVSEIVNGNLNGAQFTINNDGYQYRIAKAELITLMYGDINGDGVIDNNDLLLAQQLVSVGSNINNMPTYNQYTQQIAPFVFGSALSWQLVDATLNVIASGNDGVLVVNPQNGAQANFQSLSTNFVSIANLNNYNLVVSGGPSADNGTFAITNIVSNNIITINKQLYTSDTILQIMAGDINGDMILNSTDINLISNYILAVPPFPPTSSPANKIGTTFQALRFTFEYFLDRKDDYPSTNSNRNATIHPVPDLFLDGYTTFGTLPRNLTISPMIFTIIKQLVWDEASVVVSANPRKVPVAFNYQSGYVNSNCDIVGTNSEVFPTANPFDPGRNDLFLSNNLVVNFGGQIIRPDGYFMKMDFEIGTVILEIPTVPFNQEYTVNLLTDFVANYNESGYTRLGYPAMRFADCSIVPMTALTNNQVKFSVAVQSFSPQINGISDDGYCYSGVIVDGKIGVSLNYETGLLSLNFSNLYQDPVLQTLSTKVEITVYLKQAGWNNQPIIVNSIKLQNVLGVPTPITPMPC